MRHPNLPTAVIGAGPVGLAAAAHLVARGLEPLVFESGDGPGANVLAWGHVRLFSPWKYVVDAEAERLLTRTGWQRPPDDECPNGWEFVENCLQPLAATPELRDRIQYGTQVLTASRVGYDRQRSTGRDSAPFIIRVERSDGTEEDLLAAALIDASGTWNGPNPAGANGLKALGERQLGHRIAYGIPDVRGRHRRDYIGQRTLVLGSGHSAFNALLDLVEVIDEEPKTELVWAVRRTTLGSLFGGSEQDELPERGRLGQRLRANVDAKRLQLETGFHLDQFHSDADGRIVAASGARRLRAVDRVIVATGFRPNLSFLSELRLALDPATQSPVALAPLIDPNVHSCGTVRPHGFEELRHPEEGLFIIGMKSYGRAPTFLLLTGYEQARSVTAAIAGDLAAARDVRLVLPETGVCGGSGRDDGPPSGSCCGTQPERGTPSLSVRSRPVSPVARTLPATPLRE